MNRGAPAQPGFTGGVRARPVGTEWLDVTMQDAGVVRVELADLGIGVAAQLLRGIICDSSHIY